MAEGLEGVVAATTRLSHVDGEAGRLTIAGYAVEDLAPHVEGVALVDQQVDRQADRHRHPVLERDLHEIRAHQIETRGGVGPHVIGDVAAVRGVVAAAAAERKPVTL